MTTELERDLLDSEVSVPIAGDADPTETQEWLDSVDAVVDHAGRVRARELMVSVLRRARATPRDPARLRCDRLRQHHPSRRRARVPGR